MKLKKILKWNKKNCEFVDNLPTVYLIGCWARYGIMEAKFAGEMTTGPRGLPIPLVYHYNDHNGTCDQYELVSLDRITSGLIFTWTFDKNVANRLLASYSGEEYNFKE